MVWIIAVDSRYANIFNTVSAPTVSVVNIISCCSFQTSLHFAANDVNTSELPAECFKMFGVGDVAEAVATRRQICQQIRVNQQCSLRDMYCVQLSFFLLFSSLRYICICLYYLLPISVNKDVCDGMEVDHDVRCY